MMEKKKLPALIVWVYGVSTNQYLFEIILTWQIIEDNKRDLKI